MHIAVKDLHLNNVASRKPNCVERVTPRFGCTKLQALHPLLPFWRGSPRHGMGLSWSWVEPWLNAMDVTKPEETWRQFASPPIPGIWSQAQLHGRSVKVEEQRSGWTASVA